MALNIALQVDLVTERARKLVQAKMFLFYVSPAV